VAAEPAQNRGETAELAPVRGRPFLPGNRANPGGRPRGLAALVRDQTMDGAELIEFYLRIFRGKRQPLRYRFEAAAWLADRGFGKALQQMEVSGPDRGAIRIEYGDEAGDERAADYPTS